MSSKHSAAKTAAAETTSDEVVELLMSLKQSRDEIVGHAIQLQNEIEELSQDKANYEILTGKKSAFDAAIANALGACEIYLRSVPNDGNYSEPLQDAKDTYEQVKLIKSSIDTRYSDFLQRYNAGVPGLSYEDIVRQNPTRNQSIATSRTTTSSSRIRRSRLLQVRARQKQIEAELERQKAQTSAQTEYDKTMAQAKALAEEAEIEARSFSDSRSRRSRAESNRSMYGTHELPAVAAREYATPRRTDLVPKRHVVAEKGSSQGESPPAHGQVHARSFEETLPSRHFQSKDTDVLHNSATQLTEYRTCDAVYSPVSHEETPRVTTSREYNQHTVASVPQVPSRPDIDFGARDGIPGQMGHEYAKQSTLPRFTLPVSEPPRFQPRTDGSHVRADAAPAVQPRYTESAPQYRASIQRPLAEEANVYTARERAEQFLPRPTPVFSPGPEQNPHYADQSDLHDKIVTGQLRHLGVLFRFGYTMPKE